MLIPHWCWLFQVPKKTKQIKKTSKIIAFKMSTGTFITLFLSFYKLKSLLTTFFIPDKKWVGPLWCLLSLNFAATGVAVLSFNVSTLKFSLPATKVHHQMRGNLQRGKKIKYVINFSLIRIPILLTTCHRKKKGQAHQVFYCLNINFPWTFNPK